MRLMWCLSCVGFRLPKLRLSGLGKELVLQGSTGPCQCWSEFHGQIHAQLCTSQDRHRGLIPGSHPAPIALPGDLRGGISLCWGRTTPRESRPAPHPYQTSIHIRDPGSKGADGFPQLEAKAGSAVPPSAGPGSGSRWQSHGGGSGQLLLPLRPEGQAGGHSLCRAPGGNKSRAGAGAGPPRRI